MRESIDQATIGCWRMMERIDPVDAQIFVIHWKQPYPWANRLLKEQLEPLPEHILGRLYEAGDKEAFRNAAFWSSTSYVGNGPYRLVEWEKGVHMVYRAFDQYYLGRPKLDEVVFRIISDTSTLVANVLSGAVDATVSYILSQQAGAEVRKEWERSGEGRIILDPVWFRSARIQLEPSRTQQPALLNVGIRRALVHAIDRTTLADVVTLGAAPVPEVMIGPNDPLFSRVDQAITKYRLDRPRALALLQEAGWTRSASGVLTNTSGEPSPRVFQ